ncbi:MAG: ATP-binding cassette domain-containing protein [Spirochaetaceae bacterium]|nr:ATP-binding cassette domain-containing protein [Spirochaetaceae bacterium]
MIAVRNLAFSYGSIPILESLSFNVPEKSSYAILGSTGCGKSTLLHILAGLRSPGSGDVAVGGVPINGPRKKTAIILQDGGLMPWKTVRDNIILGLRARGTATPDALADVEQLLETLGLAHRSKAYPAAISGGERQRVALARALALEPDLLLLDEAAGALDAITRERIQELLLKVQQERRLTMVVVTHNIEEAATLGGRIGILRAGRITTEIDNGAFSHVPNRYTPEFASTERLIREALISRETA